MKIFKRWFTEFQPDGRVYDCRPGDPVPAELVERLTLEMPDYIEDAPDAKPAVAVEDDSAEDFDGAKVIEPAFDKMMRGSKKRK